jgi:hypothetical protein
MVGIEENPMSHLPGAIIPGNNQISNLLWDFAPPQSHDERRRKWEKEKYNEAARI